MNSQCENRRIALADACRILNTCVHSPTPQLVQSIADGSLETSIGSLLPFLGCTDEAAARVERRLAHCRSSEKLALSSLRIDFTRLFAHPTSPLVPICESLFKNKQRGEKEKPLLMVNRIAMALDSEYEAAGFKRSRGRMTPPDHMGTELEFLALLLDDASPTADDFADQHLGTWAPAFFSLVEHHAETSAYALFGSLGCACFPE